MTHLFHSKESIPILINAGERLNGSLSRAVLNAQQLDLIDEIGVWTYTPILWKMDIVRNDVAYNKVLILFCCFPLKVQCLLSRHFFLTIMSYYHKYYCKNTSP